VRESRFNTQHVCRLEHGRMSDACHARTVSLKQGWSHAIRRLISTTMIPASTAIKPSATTIMPSQNTV
jgi:hypothetical protein